MRAFLHRLRLAWQLLRARRFVVFLPQHPVMNLAVRGHIGPATWEAICAFSMQQHREALNAAEARLLAELQAEQAEQAALEAQIHAILKAE